MRKELNEMLLLGIMLGMVITSAIFMSLNIGNVNQKEQKQEQVFVWNDDIESVPLNGYVKIDGVVNDTIYLSPDEQYIMSVMSEINSISIEYFDSTFSCLSVYKQQIVMELYKLKDEPTNRTDLLIKKQDNICEI